MSFLQSLPAVIALNISKIVQQRKQEEEQRRLQMEKARALELQKAKEEAEKLRHQVQSGQTFSRVFLVLGIGMLLLAGGDLLVEGHLPIMQLSLGGLSLTIGALASNGS
ncbi:hypothetical protein QUB80_18230 [Chlorogloeopsis sp. ULAP01]|uniref:hypothetical protein n=1 Tax=Chlorogloeopsis sp. ULAP01 TaxID=3056483 RepID=UPI0025AB3C0E|nr:hypothetical protein [Chlorogloeopsis sp. ULAP01]MDM9382636.1 hypothetical protein [Chlorogloeopsis sp. ULAP01]